MSSMAIQMRLTRNRNMSSRMASTVADPQPAHRKYTTLYTVGLDLYLVSNVVGVHNNIMLILLSGIKINIIL